MTAPWEVNSTTIVGSSGAEDQPQWEMHVCCIAIGATNAIAPIKGEKDAFMIILYYGAGDAFTGAAKVVVKINAAHTDDRL